ncbi:uncharacterized protein NDAI_0D00900 [Naumovozyma dairenensis CBS 421]|uniref:Zn(2)-C6 fungal-type domain-containing protein n=1 Tax=Naumovozyma dairenensis (strain ATCC 10597 / BCRC 20456 / CBS 421 / NBRC 0211 / NRRL Y-12639) TaxID=1071378 RepID=G0W9E3_NAUDC|nr:hypothetical protein NDAI_0D00900 [Naumovozyma dairenensis CBS 421]CCD24404.1 hypothetical protein NDAI_0D00900 [Naumovozyma dairenensis CBS 421]
MKSRHAIEGTHQYKMSLQQKSLRRQRRSHVCITCKNQKLRCDRERPSCSRCRRIGRDCVYESPTPEETMTNHGNKELSVTSGISTDGSLENNDEFHNEKPNNSNTLQFDEKLHLWNPKDMYLTHGYQTFVDFPYGTHSIAQYDPYLRLFCPSIHGTTLADLQSRLEFILDESKNPEALSKSPFKTLEDISPLMFIEDAVVKWVDKTNSYLNSQIPLEYFNTMYTIEDRMHPSLMAVVKQIVEDIESLLVSKPTIDKLLKDFYENIYPYYPFIEIELFDQNLSKIYTEVLGSSRYKINVFQENIRFNLEILTLFLLILSITLNNPNLNYTDYNTPRENNTILSKKLLTISKKLLFLLNGFKFTTENILCCSLYVFVAEFLDPANPDMHIAHDQILTLKCLTELSYTLGLYEEPSQFTRYSNRTESNYRFFMFRRKLWIGLQSLILEFLSADGGCNEVNHRYLSNFLGKNQQIIPSFMEHFHSASTFDRQLFEIHDSVYHFHILLNNVMLDCTSNSQEQDLSKIMESLERLKKFTFRKFPLSKLAEIESYTIIGGLQWKNARFDIEMIERTIILKINMIFFSSLMNIFNCLAIYFEKKCSNNWEKYERFYLFFFPRGLDAYLEVATLTINYLRGSFSSSISASHEYFLNKSVAYISIKIISIQLSYLLRVSYKLDMVKKNEPSTYMFFQESSNSTNAVSEITILSSTLEHIRGHVYSIIHSTLERYDDFLFGIYQVMLMGNYVYYLLEHNILTKTTNEFWRKILKTNDIPIKILDKIKLKWGLGKEDQNVINYYTENPISLSSFNGNLLKTVEHKLQTADVYDKLLSVSNIPYPSFHEEGTLDQLLESNIDLFSTIIGDNLGELPIL